MQVMGLLEGEGIVSWDLKVRQYSCSEVMGDGRWENLTGCNDVTAAAMFQLCSSWNDVLIVM